MDIRSLKPVSQLVQRFGVKMLCFGPPGIGKTPILTTAPRPILLAVEPGLLSMRRESILTWEAYTPEKIIEFFDWFFKSNESKQFDTLGIDSITQLAEMFLTQEQKRNKDGRKAYGEMSIRVMEIVNALYYFPQKHIYLIAKQGTIDDNGVQMKKPYFPGQDLNVKIPHLFDEVLHIAKANVPGQTQPVTAIRCLPTFDVLARDRSGMLNELEPPHLGNLITKALS